MAENEYKILKFLKNSISFIETYGVFKIIFASLMMLFISFVTYLTFNPSFIFEKYSEFAEQKHSESFNYRMESTPIVQSITDALVAETDAMRCFIIEMHNGKYNSTGLSFNYGSMTYESLRDSVESVQEDYSDFTLDRFPILSQVYQRGKWSGSIEELKQIDRKMALKLESNGAYYVVISTIYGSKNDIGFIGITFGKDETFNKANLEVIVSKYASKISPYLDGEVIKNKK